MTNANPFLISQSTILAKWYEEGKVKLKSLDDYVNEVCEFLKYLDKDILIPPSRKNARRDFCILQLEYKSLENTRYDN
ncbi:MAG: hypothetical protein ACLS8T_23865 [Anaerobutyricum sp.]